MTSNNDTTGGAPGADLPAWDESAALAATGGDAALAAELLTQLLDGLAGELADLDRLLDSRDWPGLDDATHRMRGATAYCGVPALDTALERLKQAAKAGDAAAIAQGVQQVHTQADRLRTQCPRGAVGPATR